MQNPYPPITYQYISPPAICLMAWVQDTHDPYAYYARIDDADSETLTAWVTVPGHFYSRPVPFSALQSVALKEVAKVLQAFGRPPAATTPAWARFSNVEWEV